MFAMGSQYVDVASLSGMSKHSGGQIQYFPGFHTVNNKTQAARFDAALRRYLTRKIGGFGPLLAGSLFRGPPLTS